MSNNDYGSIVPLNLRLRAAVAEPVEKSETHRERADRVLRMGTPPTRWGAYNGAPAATRPGMPAELVPALFMSVAKAVTDPHLAGGGDVEHTPRKRDPHSGEFTAAPTAGPQSTAQDDLAAQERSAALAQRRTSANLGAAKQQARKAFGDQQNTQPQQPGQPPPGQPSAQPGQSAQQPLGAPPQQPSQPPGAQQSMSGQAPPSPMGGAGGAGPGAPGGMPQLAKPKPPNPMQQAGIPNAPPGQSGPVGAPMGSPPGQGDMAAQPIGMTTDGLPVFDDPYNPAHASFTADQHHTAAELHNQQAEGATSTGRIPTALDHQLKARIHMDLANEAQSPMQRMLSSQGMPGSASMAPGQGPPPNGGANTGLDDFLTQMTDKQPGMQNAPADQNKPMMGGPQANQGPLPRMINTHTGGPVGMQSQQAQHAGTVEQPQGMPPEPPPGAGSMPDISGPQEVQMDPLDWDPNDFLDDGTNASAGMGGGASAPPSHAGSAETEIPEPGMEPTPGSTESEPSLQNAGPSTSDNTPFTKREQQGAGEEATPFDGNATEERAKREAGAQKSIVAWFSTL